MYTLTHPLSFLRMTFHTHQIYRYRQQGRKLISHTGSLSSPQLLTLIRRIDHHGILLYRLERRFEN